MRNQICCAAIIFLLLFPPSAAAAVIHVPGDQPTIQSGIDAATTGDTVLLADGTYSGPGNTNLVFEGKAIIVRSALGPTNCIIDCENLGSGFRFLFSEGRDSVLQGLTVRNASNPTLGGAIFIVNASPTIINNILEDNAAMHGGGIYVGQDAAAPLIRNNYILSNSAYGMGGGIQCEMGCSPVIDGNVLLANSANAGGAIHCNNSSAVISNNTLTLNEAGSEGGGIFCRNSNSLITGNRITGNYSNSHGGGIGCLDASGAIINNLITLNEGHDEGGGIELLGFSSPAIIGNTIVDNFGFTRGGGLLVTSGSFPTVVNTILWNNDSSVGYDEIALGADADISVSHCNVRGGWPGSGNFSADPLFVTGPEGEFYLSHSSAGQWLTSPCVDAGDPAAAIPAGCTRIDSVPDGDQPDIGFHHHLMGLVTGPGPGYDNPPRVGICPPRQDGEPQHQFTPYGAPHYGVNVTCGDVNGDTVDDILTGPGPGAIYGPHVRGFSAEGTPLPGMSFLAYGTLRYGVNVAAGDIDGDFYDEIICGAGPGAVFGPHVRAFDYDGRGRVTARPGVSFFAYGIPRWGVNVAAGDIDGDGFDEIVTGAGPGQIYGAHVRAWNVDGGAATAMPAVNFLAYPASHRGVVVACGDLDGDGLDEIITAPGPSTLLGARIRGWNHDGSGLTPLPGCDFLAWSLQMARFGAQVFAGADLNGNGRDDLMVGSGPDPEAGPMVKVFFYDGMDMNLGFSIQPFPAEFTHGMNVAAGRF